MKNKSKPKSKTNEKDYKKYKVSRKEKSFKQRL